MAAAVVNLDKVNEGETFIMSLEFWDDVDNTIPIDVSTDTFTGSFKIGTKTIPMTITHLTPAVNVIEAKVDYALMTDLSSKGKYDIDQLNISGDKFRLIQGDVRVSQEVV